MPITVSCPYCNAPVPVPSGERRVACPRCEETVTVNNPGTGTAVAEPVPAVSSPPVSSHPANRTIALVVIAMMLGMAGLGLAFALRTVEVRRANDNKGIQAPDVVEDARPAPPAEWAGVGYLPDDVQAIAGVRVATALESAAGRALLGPLGITETNQSRWLGMAPAEVDHLLFGAGVRTLPPRVTAVIHTRATVTDRRLRAALGSARTTDHHGKSLVRGKLWANGPEGAVWRADPHTLVATQLPEDFDRVPAEPKAGAARFASPLPDLLTGRLDPAALAWLVAAVDDKSPALGLAASMLRLPAADRDEVAKLEAVAVSVRAHGTKLTLTLHVRGRDAAAGDAIAAAITESLSKAGVAVERRAGSRERPEDWHRLTATAEAEKLAGWMRGK